VVDPQRRLGLKVDRVRRLGRDQQCSLAQQRFPAAPRVSMTLT
jgi:hypothetical protein